MGEFLSYSILSGFMMLSMLLAYKMFLARENQHGYNRIVLLMIYLVAFTLFPVISVIYRILSHASSSISLSENLEMTGAAVVPVSKLLWGTVLIWIFIVGMAVVTFKTLATWFKLVAVIRSGEKIRQNNHTLVLVDNDCFAPFSWMRYIVMSRSDYDNSRSAVITHEMKHIACRHWIDLLIAQIVCIINWFNPAAWLMRDELMLVHEYQADMAVIRSGHDVHDYQMLLIKKAVGSRFPSLANSLNHSKLKKRITMMYKEKSSAGRKMKALAIVPMLSLALCVTAVPGVKAAVSAISGSPVSVGKNSENPVNKEISAQNFKVSNLNNNGNSTTVVIKGDNLGNNLTVSGGTFTTHGKTYHAKSMQCNMTNGNATITAVFPFESEFEDVSLSFNVNGKDVVLDLDGFLNNAKTVRVVDIQDSEKPSKFTVVASGNSSSLPQDMDIYIDGEKVTYSEMEKVSPNKISSITIDKQGNAMRITTVK